MSPPLASRRFPALSAACFLIRAGERCLAFLTILGAVALAALLALTLAEIAARQLWRTSLSISLEYQGYLLIASALLPQGSVLLAGRALSFELLVLRLPPIMRDAVRWAAAVLSLLAGVAVAVALWRLAFFSLAHGARSYFPSATALFWPQMLAALGGTGLAVACGLRLLALAVPHAACFRQQPGDGLT
ncbi:MAG: TRAP transporter small permease subunit [Alphaproteobacteria bacterium]|nr:MAG: TRAP transporter small permease subunit [Alphaproteobacteria bacterium]